MFAQEYLLQKLSRAGLIFRLKYRSITDIVRRREETTGHYMSDPSDTEIYCLFDPSELVSDLTVTVPNVLHPSAGLEARMLNGASE